MTVIVILSMLVGISMPSIISVRRQMMRGTSMAAITTISNAILAYAVDFRSKSYPQGLPPANPSQVWSEGGSQLDSSWKARHILPLLLTGYANNPAADGAPHSNLSVDDGVDNFGFCVAARGKTYGPYNGAERLRVIRNTGREPHTTFIDSFDNSIAYYVYDTASNCYQDSDNSDIASTISGDLGGKGIDYYAQKEKVGAEKSYGNNEYILCSPGPNGKWDAYLDDPATDDITNFLME